MENKIKNSLEKILVGTVSIGLIGSLVWYALSNSSNKGYKLLTRELTPSGDITYMIDSSKNILTFHVPLARVGMGGISKFYLSKESKKYQELIKNMEKKVRWA